MNKAILSIIVVLAIIAGGSIIEHKAMSKCFNKMKAELEIVYEKTERGEAISKDIEDFIEFWLKEKMYLNIYFPHNEIKDIDNYLAEAETFVKFQKYEFALAKMNIVREVFTHLPKAYEIKIGNIF